MRRGSGGKGYGRATAQHLVKQQTRGAARALWLRTRKHRAGRQVQPPRHIAARRSLRVHGRTKSKRTVAREARSPKTLPRDIRSRQSPETTTYFICATSDTMPNALVCLGHSTHAPRRAVSWRAIASAPEHCDATATCTFCERAWHSRASSRGMTRRASARPRLQFRPRSCCTRTHGRSPWPSHTAGKNESELGRTTRPHLNDHPCSDRTTYGADRDAR